MVQEKNNQLQAWKIQTWSNTYIYNFFYLKYYHWNNFIEVQDKC